MIQGDKASETHKVVPIVTHKKGVVFSTKGQTTKPLQHRRTYNYSSDMNAAKAASTDSPVFFLNIWVSEEEDSAEVSEDK